MADRHFACTQCGQCCNRAPELELGEAAALADVFVLRLLMRIYSLPRSVGDYLTPDQPRDRASAEFYQTKRLLSAFAATSWPAKVRRDGRVVEYVQYLSLSVLPLDLSTGACNALDGARCSIYARRPLSCRTVPLHYSRADAYAVPDLDAFVASPGHACATGDDAPRVISQNSIIDPATRAARVEAAARAQADRPWKAALVKAMKAGVQGLPSPQLVEGNAATGALSAPMLAAWQVAAATGLLARKRCRRLIETQIATITRALEQSALPLHARQTLLEMQRGYAEWLAAP